MINPRASVKDDEEQISPLDHAQFVESKIQNNEILKSTYFDPLKSSEIFSPVKRKDTKTNSGKLMAKITPK